MQRKNWLTFVLACGLCQAGTALAQQQPDFSKVELKVTKVTDNIYMLSTPVAGNIGVSIGADGVAIIDDQFAPLAPKIRAAIALLSDKPIRFVINTHWHGDHTGANESFGRNGAVIVAQGNVRKRMSAKQIGSISGRETPASPDAALPIITFAESATLHYNGDDLEATHLPAAHTDGDVAIRWRNANVIHMGDMFFVGDYPFVDNNSGGTYNGVIAATEWALAIADDNTKIMPGHGPLSDKRGLQEFHDMMVTVRERILKMIRQQKTLEQVVAAKPTADFDAKWAGSFWKPDQWVGRVYVDLRRTVK
jgi:glyoxylase-like metal-dependent hydrolase (beta-lactamase superfamily II)